ncbi:type I-E CRISPR-associated endoribonuclease Cas2e [Arcanobacterium hippocoleae]|uniref:type I-E CRISPR-associated endoribonuclease Cas2e n=1 Tax=Arcanobacterium hippocoleae TaxID=149017 RepID=UPI00333F53EC
MTAAPEHVHGYVTRFLIEADTGLYVGNISPTVCKRLWERVSSTIEDGHATMIYSDSSREQGFAVRTAGNNSNQIFDYEGPFVISALPGRAQQKLLSTQQNRR